MTSAVATILVHGPPNTPNCRKCGGIVWPHERHRPEGKVSGEVEQTGSVQTLLHKATGKMLIQSAITRWNSELEMLSHFVAVYSKLRIRKEF